MVPTPFLDFLQSVENGHLIDAGTTMTCLVIVEPLSPKASVAVLNKFAAAG